MKLAKCHPNKKYGARDMCKNCYNKWLRTTNPTYAQKCKESSTRIGRLPKAKAQRLNLTLIKRYGITTEQRQKMKEDQDFKCKLCKKEKFLVVEHNHLTGKVRGMTCHKCNILIGQVESNIKLLPRVFEYINSLTPIDIGVIVSKNQQQKEQ